MGNCYGSTGLKDSRTEALWQDFFLRDAYGSHTSAAEATHPLAQSACCLSQHTRRGDTRVQTSLGLGPGVSSQANFLEGQKKACAIPEQGVRCPA